MGIHASAERGIEIDDYLMTHARTVYAIGDVASTRRSAHAAEREAMVVFQNAVLRMARKFDDTALPRAAFTDPEVAGVGLTETEALAREPEAQVFRVELKDIARACIDGLTGGFAKVVVTASGKILGAVVVSPEASVVIQEFVVAMERGLTLSDLASTFHVDPSRSAIVANLAAQHDRSRLDKGLLRNALRWLYGYSSSKSEAPKSQLDAVPAREPSHPVH